MVWRVYEVYVYQNVNRTTFVPGKATKPGIDSFKKARIFGGPHRLKLNPTSLGWNLASSLNQEEGHTAPRIVKHNMYWWRPYA